MGLNEALLLVGRRFSSWEACRAALLPWYDAERVDSWRNTRVREVQKGFWWSDLNPKTHRLARTTILASASSASAWDRLAAAHT